jgi:hypothetical protein
MLGAKSHPRMVPRQQSTANDLHEKPFSRPPPHIGIEQTSENSDRSETNPKAGIVGNFACERPPAGGNSRLKRHPRTQTEGAMRSPAVLSIAMLAAISSAASPAWAYSLYWYRGPTKSHSESACYGFAKDAASRNNLRNIKQDNLSVSGVSATNTALAVITCIVAAGGTAHAVVMVSGDNAPEAASLAKSLFEAVRSETCFEGC